MAVEIYIQTVLYKYLLGVVVFIYILALLGLEGIALLVVSVIVILIAVWCLKMIISPPPYIWLEGNYLFIQDKLKNSYNDRLAINEIKSVAISDEVDFSGAVGAIGFYKNLKLETKQEDKIYEITFFCTNRYARYMVEAIEGSLREYNTNGHLEKH